MNVKNVLITGCSGFLAPYVVNELMAQHEFNLSGITEVKDFSSEQMNVFHVDIRERESVFPAIKEIRPDWVFHLAAYSNVGMSWKNPRLTYDVNFIGTSNLIEAVHTYSPGCRILLMSSAEIYGKNNGEPISESAPIVASSPYSLSKIAMEMAGDLFFTAYQTDIIKIRSFNFIGPGQSMRFVTPYFASEIVSIEKSETKDPVLKVGNLSAIRDFSDVRDTARYLVALIGKGKSGEVYNICSGKPYSIREILDTLLSLSSRKIEVKVDQKKLRPLDIPILHGDNTKIVNNFGLSPQYSIQKTLSDLLAYWRQQ